MSPRIGINTFVWYSPLTDDDLPLVISKVAEWGYESIELVLENPGDWTPALAAELVAEHSLVPAVSAVMPPGRNLVAAGQEEVQATQGYLMHCIDVATAVGADVVGGPVYTAVGRTWRASQDERSMLVDELREALRPVVDYAGSKGVTVAVEPLNRYETSLINTVEQVLELIDGLPAESTGVLFDTYHANIEEKDPTAALRSAGDRLAAMQVCSNDRGAPGQDHVDWAAYGRVLSDLDYRGSMSVESFTAENEVIATAASIWRPLASSQDDLARDGLAFLKGWRSSWT